MVPLSMYPYNVLSIGYRVVAVASLRNHGFLKDLGADAVFGVHTLAS